MVRHRAHTPVLFVGPDEDSGPTTDNDEPEQETALQNSRYQPGANPHDSSSHLRDRLWESLDDAAVRIPDASLGQDQNRRISLLIDHLGLASMLAVVIEVGIRQNAMQPRPGARPLVEGLEGPPRLQRDVLDQVLRSGSGCRPSPRLGWLHLGDSWEPWSAGPTGRAQILRRHHTRPPMPNAPAAPIPAKRGAPEWRATTNPVDAKTSRAGAAQHTTTAPAAVMTSQTEDRPLGLIACPPIPAERQAASGQTRRRSHHRSLSPALLQRQVASTPPWRLSPPPHSAPEKRCHSW